MLLLFFVEPSLLHHFTSVACTFSICSKGFSTNKLARKTNFIQWNQKWSKIVKLHQKFYWELADLCLAWTANNKTVKMSGHAGQSASSQYKFWWFLMIFDNSWFRLIKSAFLDNELVSKNPLVCRLTPNIRLRKTRINLKQYSSFSLFCLNHLHANDDNVPVSQIFICVYLLAYQNSAAPIYRG